MGHHPRTQLEREPGVDSVDLMEFIINLKKLDIETPDEDMWITSKQFPMHGGLYPDEN